jgi:hypothetical protein
VPRDTSCARRAGTSGTEPQSPFPALNVHHPLPDVVGGAAFAGGIAFASNIRSSLALEAVKVVEVAVTMHIS